MIADSAQFTDGVLRYQENRSLNHVPAYATGLQVRLPDGRRAYTALSATELALYFEGDRALHYDLEGRLVKIAEPGQFWRRSLSGRYLHTRKLDPGEGGGLLRRLVEPPQGDELLVAAHAQTNAVATALSAPDAVIEVTRGSEPDPRGKILPVLERAAAFDLAAARRDAMQFHALYGRVAVLPPDQYNALVVQVTEGCAYNGCTFCELYRGVPFHRKSLEEFRQHLTAVARYHGEALRARRSIFLGEANALTQPVSVLKDFLREINAHFELPAPEAPTSGISSSWWLGSRTRFDGISSFLDAFTNVHRTTGDYHDLRRHGLRRVYIGLETGSAALLQWLHKPATPEGVIRCVNMLHEVDIAVGVIVLLGAGGHENAAVHVQETARALNAMTLGRSDYIYFSPLMVYPGSQYDTQAMSDQVTPLSAEEMRQQEQQIRQLLRFDPKRGRPYLARYELETFVY